MSKVIITIVGDVVEVQIEKEEIERHYDAGANPVEVFIDDKKLLKKWRKKS